MAKHPTPKFVCPNDGELSQEDVIFVCNTCDTREAKMIEGMYVCPECETHMHPFQCRLCDSDRVSFFSPIRSG